jgi:glucans biosynthesis protein
MSAKAAPAPLAVQGFRGYVQGARAAPSARGAASVETSFIVARFSRRDVLGTASLAGSALVGGGAFAAFAAQAQTNTNPPGGPQRFGFDDVLRRARDLAAAPFDSTAAKLPDVFDRLDYDTWRDIRFRSERAFFANSGSLFRLQLFHLGHLYRRPVTINIVRDGIASPIPYSTNLFDYGRTKIDKALPIGTGFTGFRLHFPINDPRVFDEVISFLGASYYRFLGRGQRYGVSARGLAIAAGTNQEEFPFYREFWIETPDANADHATIYALLDSRSITGAYRFDLYPGQESVLEVRVSLFPRVSGLKLGIAPLTSMYFLGENDRRYNADFRMELHDSDGLLVNSASGEWIWRPLRNPASMEISTFMAKDVRGFGLMQRDRSFADYQDLDLAYESRPSYWVEQREGFGEGNVELIELPTPDETNDNIVASFVPHESPAAGSTVNLSYRMVASLDLERLSPNGRAVNTFQTVARALGSREVPPPHSRRLLIDFAGGDLAYYSRDPSLVELVPSVRHGRVLNSFVVSNPHVDGLRAVIDVQVDEGQVADIRAFLRVGARTLTETWTAPMASP